jgi:hypothetical protein
VTEEQAQRKVVHAARGGENLLHDAKTQERGQGAWRDPALVPDGRKLKSALS